MRIPSVDRQDGGPRRARATVFRRGLSVAILLLSGCTAHIPQSTPLPSLSDVARPAAYADLCRREPQLCRVDAAAGGTTTIAVDRASFERIAAVNRAVNAEISYTSDSQVFGQTEFWARPDGAGDCEDFAILKLERLLAEGFPRRALRLAIAVRPDGLLHAVLTVKTDRGTYVLDNNHAEPQPWHKLGYSGWRWENPGQQAWLSRERGGFLEATAAY